MSGVPQNIQEGADAARRVLLRSQKEAIWKKKGVKFKAVARPKKAKSKSASKRYGASKTAKAKGGKK